MALFKYLFPPLVRLVDRTPLLRGHGLGMRLPSPLLRYITFKFSKVGWCVEVGLALMLVAQKVWELLFCYQADALGWLYGVAACTNCGALSEPCGMAACPVHRTCGTCPPCKTWWPPSCGA